MATASDSLQPDSSVEDDELIPNVSPNNVTDIRRSNAVEAGEAKSSNEPPTYARYPDVIRLVHPMNEVPPSVRYQELRTLNTLRYILRRQKKLKVHQLNWELVRRARTHKLSAAANYAVAESVEMVYLSRVQCGRYHLLFLSL